MKTLILIAALFFAANCTLAAQTQEKANPKTYKSWIYHKTPTNAKSVSKGFVISTSDSTIGFRPTRYDVDKPQIDLRVEDINKIKFRKKGKVGLGLLIGVGIALILTATASEDDFDVAAGLIVGVPICGAYGMAISSGKIKIPINGDRAKYQKQREKIKKYTLTRG